MKVGDLVATSKHSAALYDTLSNFKEGWEVSGLLLCGDVAIIVELAQFRYSSYASADYGTAIRILHKGQIGFINERHLHIHQEL